MRLRLPLGSRFAMIFQVRIKGQTLHIESDGILAREGR